MAERTSLKMPFPGGASAKTGMRYESLWTVSCMTDVLKGDADSITLEPPGEAGAEFCLKKHLGIEYHQVKRQISGVGNWTLRRLDSRGALGYFNQKLDDPSATCVFVSAHSAHPLDELTTRARATNSFQNFQDSFLTTDEWSENFRELCNRWGNTDPKDAYQRLKRVYVRTFGENDLRETVVAKLETLVNGVLENAPAVLSEFALDQIHQTLDSAQIRRHLESRGFSERAWGQSVADSIRELNETYAAGIQPTGIGGEIVDRAELERIFSVFDGNEKRVALVAGKAGAGKSSLISQAISKAEKRGWTVLALRVDRIEPRLTPREVGMSLGLPVSPASSLAGVAGGQDCLLAVDQLDAVSLASGRNPEFFDCIGAVLEQSRHHPNMRVISACRKFDLDNDPRLRQLVGDGGIAQEIPLDTFDDETVRNLTANWGMNVDALSRRQMDLLALPIHLRLLSESMANDGVSQGNFRTSKDIYDRFWRFKRRRLESFGLEYAHIRNATNLIIEHMNSREVLFVPDSRLDEYERAVSVMESENILVRDGSKLSFFHESFFDYLFARSVADSGDFDLAAYIHERDQSLFIRSQVRQILLHQREAFPMDALKNVKRILNDERIRPHLKSIALSLLGSLDDPTQEEWEAIEPILHSEMSNHVWRVINGSHSWFDLLHRLGIVGIWLANGDLAVKTMQFLESVHKHRPGEVVKLLSPYIGWSTQWDKRLMRFVERASLEIDRELFDMALRIVDTAPLDSDMNRHFWFSIRESLAKTKPEWVCELLARRFAKRMVSSSDFVDPYDMDGRIIFNLAKAAPEKFVPELMPFALAAAAMDKQIPGYATWTSQNYIEGFKSLNLKLFIALEVAMRWLAQNRPDSIQLHLESLKASSGPMPLRLLARSYEVNGDRFADEAVEYIIKDLSKLVEIDYIGKAAITGQLIKSVTPYCSPENLEQLERLVLEYYPEWERSDRRFRGISQLRFLENIEPSRLSDKASGRLRELKRKHLDTPAIIPTSGEAVEGGAASPIPEESARKMSDDNWLRAIARYSSNLTSTASDVVPRKGGAIELSRVLQTLAKERPARFVGLLHRMPDGANTHYFEAVLNGISGSDLDEDTVEDACQRCHEIPGRPLGIPIVQLLESLPKISEKGLRMVSWYATEFPDPEPSHSLVDLTGGVKFTKITAVKSMGQLIVKSSENFAHFKPYLKSVANDHSIVVRTNAADVLSEVLNYDRDLAVDVFFDLCNADETLLASYRVEMFLNYALPTHYKQLEPILLRMVASDNKDVARAGARRACLASFTNEDALGLARYCVSAESKHLRMGAAEIYSQNFKLSGFPITCEETLGELLLDPDREVSNMTSRFFLQFKGRELQDYLGLIESYIQSDGFDSGYHGTFTALTETTANIPDTILTACEKLLGIAESGNPTRREHEISSLAIRVYRRSTDPKVKSRCLDIIDRLTILGAFDLDKAMDEIER